MQNRQGTPRIPPSAASAKENWARTEYRGLLWAGFAQVTRSGMQSLANAAAAPLTEPRLILNS